MCIGLLHRFYSTVLEWKWRRLSVVRGADHMLSEKSQWTQNGTMFVDLDWPLNASSPLTTSAELLVFVTGRMPRIGKLPELNLLTGQKSSFTPRRGDSLHRFKSNLAEPTDTCVRLAVQNFASIGGNAAPKYQKFPLFGKESPRRCYSLDRFWKFLRGFTRLKILL